ncbi:uncharacterized protein LOC128224680 [Mya arenaria]|uniref:uncharacterized protein LOC128224680 n=1 Tax=Mya arenaria TaxID=6604 RepID=UPI0022E69D2A|nr:uncharacterized protein LOC128224680 [Mya arenaria]
MVFDCTFDQRRLRWVTVGLLILTFCQTIIFIGLSSGLRFKRTSSTPEPSRQCLACDDLKPALYNFVHNEKEINSLRQSHNYSLCCGTFDNVMKLRIERELSLQYYDTSNSDPSIIGELFIEDCELESDMKTPKAKLVGVVDSVPSAITKGHSKIRWNKNNRTFTENNCIHLELEGEIFIRKPGYYIVSSTLHVNTSGTYNTTRSFSHHINLLSHMLGTTGSLMQRQRSMKESGDGVFTSLMSAVFKLQKYDRISVSVSHPEYIARSFSADNFLAYFTYNLN